MKFFNVIIAFLATVSLCASGSAQSTNTGPGISDSQPESGRFVQVGDLFMVPYTVTMPDGETEFEMIPIPGGTVMLGSPEDEPERTEDEGPRASVAIPPFWMAKTEVSWAEYDQYRNVYSTYKKLKRRKILLVNDENQIDAVTVPTPLYKPPHTFEFGHDPQQPAVTMTQYAAKQYTKWMSGLYE